MSARRRARLDGARVILTGAAGGIGTAAVEALTLRGAQVAGIDVLPADGIVTADVRDPVSVEEAITACAERLGGLDVLVNNA